MSAWIVVAAAGAVAAVDTAAFFQGMFHQPLVICTLLGAGLGSPLEGAYLGALLQMLWLSELPVGAATYSDYGPAAAGAAGGALMVLQSGHADLGLAGLAVLLTAVPLAWVGGHIIRVQREIQSRFLPRVIASVERNRPGRVRWYILVGIGHSAIRGVVEAALTAAVALLLLWGLKALGLEGQIPPYALLAGMLGAGLGVTLKLFSGKEFLPWLAGGVMVGIITVVVL